MSVQAQWAEGHGSMWYELIINLYGLELISLDIIFMDIICGYMLLSLHGIFIPS